MLKYKDIVLGQCWTFADKPSVPYVAAAQTPDDLQDGWDWDPPDDWDAWNNRPVELLEHYSTHPRPTPLGKGGRRIWKVVDTKEVRPGQWYCGVFSLDTAREVCQDFNADRHKPDEYRTGVGPIADVGFVGFVIVHIVDHDDRNGEIAHLRARKTGGLMGIECLELYERGMREERVMRIDGKTYVRADGDGGNGLTAMQVEAAQELWRRTLAQKQREVCEKESLQVLVDQEVD